MRKSLGRVPGRSLVEAVSHSKATPDHHCLVFRSARGTQWNRHARLLANGDIGKVRAAIQRHERPDGGAVGSAGIHIRPVDGARAKGDDRRLEVFNGERYGAADAQRGHCRNELLGAHHIGAKHANAKLSAGIPRGGVDERGNHQSQSQPIYLGMDDG